MSRDFKNYAKRIRHYWMNNPDSAHQICTVCGIKRVRISKNYETTVVYVTKDGVKHNENQPCINN